MVNPKPAPALEEALITVWIDLENKRAIVSYDRPDAQEKAMAAVSAVEVLYEVKGVILLPAGTEIRFIDGPRERG